ncbi:nitroreductase/quinone reductase family protein [Gordonia aurantiaca]|uniref:nitroreductase/quinone reductase family protein n=1 Tax=Gordonia sp. B21 TaxID=3151852 RepID=UPI003265C42B
MSFTTSVGTRGGRVPRGPVMQLVNKAVTPIIRRRGRLGGQHALILHTIGAKSGKERVVPVDWFPGPGGTWLIVASANGAAHNPAWFHNIKAHPDRVWIEVDGETVDVRAEQLLGDERAEAWKQIGAIPQFDAYQQKTDREIPIIRLTRR